MNLGFFRVVQTRIRLLLENEHLTSCVRRTVNLFRTDLCVVLEFEGISQNFHNVENGHNNVFLVVFLDVMAHLQRIVSETVHFESNWLCLVSEIDQTQMSVDGFYNTGRYRSVEREALLVLDLEASRLDLECLLQDDVRHRGFGLRQLTITVLVDCKK
jgi:hypothetical protein